MVMSYRSFGAAVLLLANACGGGGGDDPSDPSIQISGQVRLNTGAPAPNDVVRVEIARICFQFSIYNWFGQGTSDSSGNYVINVPLKDVSDCTNSDAFKADSFRIQVSGYSCPGDRQMPCYYGGATNWSQKDFAANTGVNLQVERKARILGVTQFPGASVNTNLLPVINPDLLGGQGGRLDGQGRFFFGPLEPGTYSVSFPPDKCASIGFTGCNGAYDFTPPDAIVSVVDQDIDIAFTAVRR